MSVASCAILSNFFEEQGRQNHPKYLSGLSRTLFPTTFLETAVYATVRRLTNRIHALEAQQSSQNGEIANVARLRKTSVATFYVYAAFQACYLPFSCVYPLYYMNSGKMLKLLLSYTLTLVYLNSSLNPLIYCWKMKHIRQAVLEMLRNTFSNSQ